MFMRKNKIVLNKVVLTTSKTKYDEKTGKPLTIRYKGKDSLGEYLVSYCDPNQYPKEEKVHKDWYICITGIHRKYSSADSFEEAIQELHKIRAELAEDLYLDTIVHK